jgi:cytosine/adenosine deaminase-related metal-dependent hydrolase
MVRDGQMSGARGTGPDVDFVTRRAARCLGLDDCRRADLVVFDDATPTGAARTAVISRGRVVARTSPVRTTVTVNGRGDPVMFRDEGMYRPGCVDRGRVRPVAWDR